MVWTRDNVVLITGGSAGLGAALSQAWARAGASVAICGRDVTRLEKAVNDLRSCDADAEGFSVDVTQDDQVAALFEKVRQRFGRLDVLINNVGQSTRGLAAETTPDRFRELLEINFLSTVRCTRAALPLLQQTKGHLVFIGSLASKVVAVFGSVSSEQICSGGLCPTAPFGTRSQGVHVLLVCPGPIAREDAGARYDQEANQLPESAKRPGGGVHLSGIQPDQLANRIIRACERREPEVVWPRKARWLFAISQLWPTLGDWIIRRQTE